MEGAADDLAVGSQTVLSVIAPVGVANVIGVSSAANTGVTSLDLDHDLIDLIELRSGRVERLRSVVTSGDSLGVSITTVGASGASSIVILVVVTVVSAALVVAMFVVSISANGLDTNRVEGVVSGG